MSARAGLQLYGCSLSGKDGSSRIGYDALCIAAPGGPSRLSGHICFMEVVLFQGPQAQ
jgi:hypothetical protein